jgi:hypothetical protein
VPLGPDDSPEELVLKQGRSDFLNATHLEAHGPGDYRVTLPQGYQRLLEHICGHRYYRGLEVGHEVPWDETVSSWRENVYRPMLEVIRRHDVMSSFPERTETDLYLFLMDNLHYLRNEHGEQAPAADRAVEEFKRSHGRKPSLLDRVKPKRLPEDES